MSRGGQGHLEWLLGWVARLAWGAIPVAYLLGYIAWGFYALSLGTGYLAVGHERYLSAGFTLMGACLMLVGAALMGGWAAGRARKGSLTDLGHALLVLIAFVLVVFAVESIFSVERVVLSADIRGRFRVGLGIAFCFGFFVRPWRSSTRKRVVSLSDVRGLVGLSVAFIAVLVAMWGQSVLPYMAQEFGGGAPECATLILPRLQEFNATIEVEAYVFHRDQNWVVYSEASDEHFFSPSILDVDEVLAFSWCHDGRYPTVYGEYPNLPGFPHAS